MFPGVARGLRAATVDQREHRPSMRSSSNLPSCTMASRPSAPTENPVERIDRSDADDEAARSTMRGRVTHRPSYPVPVPSDCRMREEGDGFYSSLMSHGASADDAFQLGQVLWGIAQCYAPQRLLRAMPPVVHGHGDLVGIDPDVIQRPPPPTRYTPDARVNQITDRRATQHD
jgi:hypothetical protein